MKAEIKHPKKNSRLEKRRSEISQETKDQLDEQWTSLNEGKLQTILNTALSMEGKYQVRYSDYEADQWTVPVNLNPDRIARVLTDNSVSEVRIIIKP